PCVIGYMVMLLTIINVNQSGHVTALEGGLVTLSCNYTTSSTSPDLFWYIQLTRNSPQYVLRRDRYSEGSNSDEFKKRFDSRLNFTSSSVPLTIQRLQLSDSAVFYCALKPTLLNDNTPVCIVYNTTLKLYPTLYLPDTTKSSGTVADDDNHTDDDENDFIVSNSIIFCFIGTSSSLTRHLKMPHKVRTLLTFFFFLVEPSISWRKHFPDQNYISDTLNMFIG
uniref:Ig-like domain-containing protein n=1 Tax=Oncorhynchus kisutch TaxID=8019 RepID=A0A8C7I3F4_ONCKI